MVICKWEDNIKADRSVEER